MKSHIQIFIFNFQIDMFAYNISPELVVFHCSLEQVTTSDPMLSRHASCNFKANTIIKVGFSTIISGESL